MNRPHDSEATRREFDEVMRRTRFATIEQVAADLRELPVPEPPGPPADPDRIVSGRDSTALPSRSPAHTR